MPKERFLIICIESECRDLALSLISTFDSADWEPQGIFTGQFQNPIGIVLFQTNVDDHKLADAIERATNGRLKITVKKSDFPNTQSILIGIKGIKQ